VIFLIFFKDFNVGVNLKSIGSYLKSSLVKNLTGNNNSNNSLNKNVNLKNSVSSVGVYNNNSNNNHATSRNSASSIGSSSTSNTDQQVAAGRLRHTNGNSLVQRHNSNPMSSYTGTNVTANGTVGTANGLLSNHQSSRTSNSRLQHHHHHHHNHVDSTANALPRIRINS
jgi:hypothetical protein